ncbi:hypothetical protein V6N12_046751 [Hibiscus sabdariffa]|uniref:Uncharacterized protein n=1 Tax=Hibiscus sabdariffa TaxID=183260 RepID=A0ABR2A9K3_9ROSI
MKEINKSVEIDTVPGREAHDVTSFKHYGAPLTIKENGSKPRLRILVKGRFEGQQLGTLAYVAHIGDVAPGIIMPTNLSKVEDLLMRKIIVGVVVYEGDIGEKPPAKEITRTCLNKREDFEAIPSTVSVIRGGAVRINVDGAFIPGSRAAAVGMVARNRHAWGTRLHGHSEQVECRVLGSFGCLDLADPDDPPVSRTPGLLHTAREQGCKSRCAVLGPLVFR